MYSLIINSTILWKTSIVSSKISRSYFSKITIAWALIWKIAQEDSWQLRSLLKVGRLHFHLQFPRLCPMTLSAIIMLLAKVTILKSMLITIMFTARAKMWIILASLVSKSLDGSTITSQLVLRINGTKRRTVCCILVT